MLFLILLNGGQSYSQKVTGTFTDIHGKALNRLIIWYNGGTSMGLEGVFEFELAKSPDTVRFISEGYTTIHRVVHAGEHLKIRMTPLIHQIQEVIINTGYQQLKPNEINGAVSSIGTEALESRASLNILDRIVGQSNGVLEAIGKSKSQTGITIRGLGTINGPIDPLIVLDGFIYEGDINNINPDDVENVSILKDAAAASIWGARAGNGVIVITTFKGKLNQPMQVDMHIGQTINPIPELGGTSFIGGEAAVELERFLFEKGHFDNTIRNTPYSALTPVVEVLLAQREGKIDAITAESQLQILAQGDKRKAYRDAFYKNGLTQQYGLTARGGDEKHAYVFSTLYNHVNGNTYNTQGRLNLRTSNQFRILDQLTFSIEGQYMQSNNRNGQLSYDTYSTAGRKPDYMTFNDLEGNPIHWNILYRSAYTDTAGMGLLLDWKMYPLEDYKHNRQFVKRDELNANLSLQYQPFSFLKLTGSYQHQFQWELDQYISTEESYRARDLINKYTSVNRNTGTLTYVVPIGGIESSRYSSINSHTWRLQSDFIKLVGSHTFQSMLGVEGREAGKNNHANSTRYGYFEDPLTFTQIDFINPHVEFLTGRQTRIGSDNLLSQTRYRFLSYYGNFSYLYRGKYSISASARKDGSNIFGANTNDRWKPLWSAGMGWRISEENFFEVDWLNTLRLTATYGHSGNVDMSKTASPIARYHTESVTRLPVTRVYTVNNPNLRWEQLAQFNTQLDFVLQGNRFRGGIGYFQKTGTDLYGITPYDYTGWGVTTTVTDNVANMKGYGIEVDLHSVNLQSNAWSWDSDLYFNWNKDITTKYYYNGTNTAISRVGSGSTINPVVGYPLYGVAAFKWGGLDEQGDPLGYIDGKPSKDYRGITNWAATNGDNKVFFGSGSPVFYGSLINNVKWKNLAVSFNLNYRLGYYVRKSSFQASTLISNSTAHMEYLKRWQKTGDELHTNIPAFVYPLNSNRESFYATSAINIIKGDHIRLDYINLHYSFNTTQWKRPFKRLLFNAGIQPLGIIWRANKEGIDPDYPTQLRRSMNFTFGLKASL